jgi:hypothetical protein
MRLLRMFTMVIAFLAVSAVIQFSSAAPDGERGVVVVEGVVMDNLPDGGVTHHASLRVGFVNYAAGVPDAQVTLELLDGEGGTLASTVAIGGDPAGGKSDVDGMVAFDLRTMVPHEGGMFMFRLTVDATGSAGSDHKVLNFSADCPPDEDEGGGGGGGGGGDEGGGEVVGVAGAAGAVASQPGFAG